MTKANKRIIGIDLVKCIACIGVVLLHVSMPVFYNNDVQINTNSVLISKILYYFGTGAVPLFFMANGFFVLNKSNISWRYIWKKIFLIMIPIISWNLLLYIGYLLKGDYGKNLVTIIVDSLLQRGFFFQFWFLGSLLILLLAAFFLNNLLKRSLKLYVLILILLISISVSIDIYNHFSGVLPLQTNVIQTFRLWTWLSDYMLGGLLGYLYIQNNKFIKILHRRKSIGIWLLFFSILFVSYSILNSRLLRTPFAEYNYDNLIFIIWVILLFVSCLMINKFSRMNTTIIEVISKYSFGIYIVHVPILKVFCHFMPINSLFTNVLGILFVFVGSLILVYLFSKIPLVRKLVIF